MILDEEFVNQLKEGRTAAYELFVKHFEGPLYRFFFYDHHDHHTAQEQTAETFSQLVRSLPKMRGGHTHLKAYVFIVARRVQQRRWRQPKKKHLSIDLAYEVSDERPSPLAEVSSREQLDQVLLIISSFDQQLRNVFLLRFVEGYSLEEVSSALEIPIGTVKSHIHRGRLKLNNIFSEEEYKK